MSDRRVLQWANILGKRATMLSAGCPGKRAVMDVLLGLPANLRTVVLQQMLQHTHADTALAAVPRILQSALVAAMVDQSGTLEAPSGRADGTDFEERFIAQLPSLDSTAHPPLRALRIMNGKVPRSAAHVLADVLPQQTQLTQLCLRLPVAAADVERLLRALCPLLPLCPSLLDVQLHEGCPCASEIVYGVPEACLPLLTAALPRLTRLERLTLGQVACGSASWGNSEVSTLDEQRAYVQRGSRFLAAVAAHPGLTSLQLGVCGAMVPFVWPEAFPRLRALSLTLTPSGDLSDSMSVELLLKLGHDRGRMHATCPCLTQLEVLLRSSPYSFGRCLERWVPLGRSSQPCDTMEVLRLEIAPTGTTANMMSANEKEEGLWSRLEGTVAACPNLSRLEIAGMAAFCCCPALAPRLPSLLHLTRLQLLHRTFKECHTEWTQLTESLALLTCLREVHLGAYHAHNGTPVARLLETLAGAAHLTALHLEWQPRTDRPGQFAALDGAACAAARPLLGRLRSLRLRGPVRLQQPQQMWAALAAMPQLQDLQLAHVIGSSRQVVVGFAGTLSALRCLTHLHVGGQSPSLLTDELVGALTGGTCPTLRKVTVSGGFPEPSQCESFIDAMAEQGIEVYSGRGGGRMRA